MHQAAEAVDEETHALLHLKLKRFMVWRLFCCSAMKYRSQRKGAGSDSVKHERGRVVLNYL